MNIRVLRAYQEFSDLPLLCGVYPDHGELICRLGKDDEVQLYCIVCEYYLSPGIELYKQICASVARLKPEWKDKIYED